MKKPPFEDELLRALQNQMQGPPQAAARVRVSKRLEGTFVGLDLGLANLASLPSTTPALKTAAMKVAGAKATSVPLGAAKTLGVAAPALSMSTHPLATILATFAVGAVAGTGIMVASEVIPQSKAPSAYSVSAPSDARRDASSTRYVHPAPAEPATSALEPTPPLPPPVFLSEPPPHHTATRTVPLRVRIVQPAAITQKPLSAGTPQSARSGPATVSMADALGAQQSLLDQAREALARGDSELALSSLAQHEQAFASTLLEEERVSLKIKSLMGSGRVNEARALATGFESHFPHSLLLPSIRAAVSTNP